MNRRGWNEVEPTERMEKMLEPPSRGRHKSAKHRPFVSPFAGLESLLRRNLRFRLRLHRRPFNCRPFGLRFPRIRDQMEQSGRLRTA
jgi:hypothetical protein